MTTTETGQHTDLPGARPPPLPRASVVHTHGAPMAAPRFYPLPIGSTPVGREPPDGDGIQLSDGRASRVHARLKVAGDFSVTVDDGSSKNGTFVNGQRLSPGVARLLRD